MSFDKKGDNKISVLSIIAVLAISISLVVGAVSINNSLNQTNNTPINETPLLNESLNLAINLLEEDLSLLSEQDNPISQDIGSINQTEESIANKSVNKTIEKPVLAEFVNGQSINTPEIQEYIRWYNNFSSLKFEEIGNKTEISAPLKAGNFNSELKGFIINNKKYAFELLACDKETDSCEFRINGIRTNKVHLSKDKGPMTFNLNDGYGIKVNSIKYHICDPNLPVCDKRYEAYDLVDIEITEK